LVAENSHEAWKVKPSFSSDAGSGGNAPQKASFRAILAWETVFVDKRSYFVQCSSTT